VHLEPPFPKDLAPPFLKVHLAPPFLKVEKVQKVHLAPPFLKVEKVEKVEIIFLDYNIHSMSTPYGITRSMGTISNYVYAPVFGPLSTNQTPGNIPHSNYGALPGRPTPQQFYPSQEPVYADMNTNARHQYLRTAQSVKTIAGQNATGKQSRPIAYTNYSNQKRTATSSHMNYIAPKDSSMYLNIKKSTAIGKSSYKVGLPTESLLSTKNYYPSGTRSSLRRVRSGGCVSPAKKGAIENKSLCSGSICAWGPSPRFEFGDGSVQTIVCLDGTVLTSYDFGRTWSTNNTLYGNTLYYVKMSYNGEYKVAVGSDNKLYIFKNYRWSQNVDAPSITNIDISESGQYQLATSGGNVIRSTDYGINWAPSTDLIEYSICPSVSANGQRQVVATSPEGGYGMIYISNDYGNVWNPTNIVSDQYGWIGVNISGDGSIITAGSLEGVIQYSNDSGVTWNTATIEAPGFTSSYCGLLRSSYDGQHQVACAGIVLYNSSFPLDPSRGYLFLSSNYGATWQKASIAAPYDNIFWLSASISKSGKVITAIGVMGTIYIDQPSFHYFRSLDYGVSFQRLNLQYPMVGIDIN
jgi:hypothetical protein